MSRIKAIPTTYAGVKFRSKLEARAAQYFDRAKIKWLYEAEGYDIDGVWYLPDFWLPDHRSFVEVKGLIDDSVSKTKALAKSVPENVSVFMATAEQVSRWESGDGRISKIEPWGYLSEWKMARCPVCEVNVITPVGKMHCFAIYLAGKVRGHGDWRHSIFPALSALTDTSDVVMEWGYTAPYNGKPPLGREHHYCGPYFAASNSDHSAGLGQFTKHDAAENRRSELFRMAKDAIESCDLFFAWLDDVTCYGTLVEIGIAKTLGKAVYIGIDPRLDEVSRDMWFALEAGHVVGGNEPIAAIKAAIRNARGGVV